MYMHVKTHITKKRNRDQNEVFAVFQNVLWTIHHNIQKAFSYYPLVHDVEHKLFHYN